MSATNTIAVAPGLPQSRAAQRRVLQESHAATDPIGFLVLAAQIAGLFFVFRYFHLESYQFIEMSGMVFAAFLIHYWLPFRFKEIFWVAASIAGSFVLLNPAVAAMVLVAGLGIYVIVRCPLAFRWRLAVLIVFFAAFLYAYSTKPHRIPLPFYAVFSAIFAIRIITYAYDLAHAQEPPSLLSYLSYFLILPNYHFMVYPVVDFQTMRVTFYRRNIHDVAQQGIRWMVRGCVQLLLLRVVYYFDDPYLPDRVTSLPRLISYIVLLPLLYLRISGSFHIIVGMLHLFGYDLPETNRRYFLASSFLDYWRRVNIYWKDFMLKVVYFPVYFKFRKRGDLRAQVLGTTAVFAVSWALHSYGLWITGGFSWNSTSFWILLASLVIANVVYDSRHKTRRTIQGWWSRGFLALRIAGTFATIAVLWSLDTAPTLSSWLYLMTRWARGPAQ